MLCIRELKPTINKQTEGELFTLIIRNVKLETSIERDIQRNLLKKPKNNKNSKTNRKLIYNLFISYSHLDKKLYLDLL